MLRMMSTYHMGAHVKPRPFVDTHLPLQPVFAQEGYAGHASLFGHLVAAPRVARRAKRGGARRDRTADLLHAMQALSQLSYDPIIQSVGLGQTCRPNAKGDLGGLQARGKRKLGL